MKTNTITCNIAVIATLTITAVAHAHSGSLGGNMKHIYVTLQDATLDAAIGDPDVPMPQLRDLRMGHDYSGNQSILNGAAHNAQYGWMAGGFISLPSDTNIFVRLLDQTPGLRTYSWDSFDPLFSTDGSSDTWAWSGAMIHNWYAIDLDLITTPDMPVFAQYEVYIGHDSGVNYAQPIADYTPATIRLDFTAIPEPAVGLALLGLPLIFGRRRRLTRGIIES